MRSTQKRLSFAVCAMAAASNASAHFFGVLYSLPIPFWMYAYGAAAALVVSFILVGYFVNAGSMQGNFRSRVLTDGPIAKAVRHPALLAWLRMLSVFGLFLTIATGLIGSASPYDSFTMTLFWIAFVLGFTYLCALLGDVYAVINPWRALYLSLARCVPRSLDPPYKYPARLGYWPALALYILFIWVELFGHAGPRALALSLLAYTAITLGGCFFFGVRDWIRYGEFLSVFLRLIGKMSPFEFGHGPGGIRCLRVGRPFMSLVTKEPCHASLVVFVLAMLSSTAFDGAHETLPWVSLFWKGIYPLLQPAVITLSAQPYAAASNLYYAWQWLMLPLSPFIYYGVYLLFIVLTKLAAKSDLSVGELGGRFALTMIPIAFVYNVTHYYTLLITQGPNLLTQISDPFGKGWNLLGTAEWNVPPIIPSAGFVWHSQVWLILAGHIVSVYLAHLQALQLFASTRQATASQLPMLLLMVIFTTVGLWILSLPIAPA